MKQKSFKIFRLNQVYSLFLVIGLLIPNVGCRKLVEVRAPSTSLNAANVYTADATAAAVLTGIYAEMSQSNANIGLTVGFTSLSLFPALSADELTLYNLSNDKYFDYYSNRLTNTVGDFWNIIYPIIFTTNTAIEGLNNSTRLTPSVKQQLLGEAKFMRALCYFYLVNLYGDVPLAISTDYEVNRLLPRAPQEKVYQQIIADLKEAQELLNANYVESDGITSTSTTERIRPTKWAATALLARTYLYTGDFNNAEIQSTAVINNTALYSLPALNDVFQKNSREAIWQLQPVWPDIPSNTGEGALYILPETGPNNEMYPVYLSDSVVNSFEEGDRRKEDWVGSVNVEGTTYYYPYKYKIGAVYTEVTEYIMVQRLGEQYLIRAESRVQLDNTSGAVADLNVIRTRAGLSGTTATTKATLLTAIQHERRVELFTEWGHRWLDLKRTHTVDVIMSEVTPQKGGIWSTNWQWYPIPLDDLQKNTNLEQNIGYN